MDHLLLIKCMTTMVVYVAYLPAVQFDGRWFEAILVEVNHTKPMKQSKTYTSELS